MTYTFYNDRERSHKGPSEISEIAAKFREAIRAAGITPPDKIEADGQLHRFPTNGKGSDDAGWYVLHADNIPAGSFGCWRSHISETWRADLGRSLSPAEHTEHRQRIEEIRLQREAEEARRYVEAAKEAAKIWQNAPPAPETHEYLAKKRIGAHGARLDDHGRIVIPIYCPGGELSSLQFIEPDAAKRFLPGGQVKGCFFSLGTLNGAPKICIGTGFATCATIHEATGLPVVVAFFDGNLKAVGEALREQFPDVEIIVCADDDADTDVNPGLARAKAAAIAVQGRLAVPDFGPHRPSKATDFNDLAAHCGIESVANAIANATPSSNGHGLGGQTTRGWMDPLPLVAQTASEPYPLDALPPTVRAAVEEVQRFTKAPIPLVASSALAALSLAIQAHVDVKRAEKLSGPTGLFLLIIADSGERKTTNDGFFSAAIREYQQRQVLPRIVLPSPSGKQSGRVALTRSGRLQRRATTRARRRRIWRS